MHVFPFIIILAALLISFIIASILDKIPKSFSISSILSLMFGLSSVAIFLFWILFPEYQNLSHSNVSASTRSVLEFLGMYGLVVPSFAVPFGIIGLINTKKRGLRGKWFAITGIILGIPFLALYLMMALSGY